MKSKLRVVFGVFCALAFLLAHPVLAQVPGTFSPTLLVTAPTVATATFASGAIDNSNQTAYTFTSQGIGPADVNRYVGACVAIEAGSPATITSVTVGGAATTSAVSVGYDGNQRWVGVYITSAPYITGSTANIVVNLSSTGAHAAIQVYSIVGLSSTTPTATATDAASPLSQSIAISAGGFAIGCGQVNAITTWTWTGLAEDYDASGTESNSYTSASLNSTAGATPTAAATPGAGSQMGMAVAAFR